MLAQASALPGGDMQAADLPQLLSLQNSWVPTVVPKLAQVFSTCYLHFQISQLCPFCSVLCQRVPGVMDGGNNSVLFDTDRASDCSHEVLSWW